MPSSPPLPRMPKPAWLKIKPPGGENYTRLKHLMRELKLNTVCEEAACPNVAECWGGGTATVMLMGDTCTRGCRFCHVKSGNPKGLLDLQEPQKVAYAVSQLGLTYLVLTSVDRDDLPDGGADHFARTVEEIKKSAPKTLVEVLIPDFSGDVKAIDRVIASGADVIAHNVETVERLSPSVRDRRCTYRQSLFVLDYVKKQRPSIYTKSSIMLGLGETREELNQAMDDLRAVGAQILTFGQYLRPSNWHLPVDNYVEPAIFKELEELGLQKGFLSVPSGPLVRSSYKAGEKFLEGPPQERGSHAWGCKMIGGDGMASKSDNAGLKATKGTKKAIAERYAAEEGVVTKKPSVLRDDCLSLLRDDFTVAGKAPELSKEQLLKMYRNMVLTRVFDERNMMLQRQGRIGFYVPSYGQEAIQTGTAAALDEGDWLFPSYREPGVFLYRGASLKQMICNLYGNQGDICQGRQMPVHYSFAEKKVFSVSSPIATQVIQAVGAAMAFKIRKEKQVAVTYFGDGATSENDFHSGMTFGGAYKAPTIFICTNNQYAISVPLFKQTGAKRLVDKAVGYGMTGVAVDGNDILAVYQATSQAVARAKRGEGPTFIECLTLRMGPHSSSDDPTRYRDEKLYEAWKDRDPILRFAGYLKKQGFWDDTKEAKLQEELKATVIAAIDEAEPMAPPKVEDLFEGVYAKLTPQLERQRKQLMDEEELRGKFENTSVAFPL